MMVAVKGGMIYRIRGLVFLCMTMPLYRKQLPLMFLWGR